MALRARMQHKAKNWMILTDYSNVFNTLKRTAVLTEAATCVPALTPFVAKRYGERSAPVFFQMFSKERRKIDCSSGVQLGDAMGTTLFCMPLLPVLKQNGEEFEPKGVERSPTWTTSASEWSKSHRTHGRGAFPAARAGQHRYYDEP